MYKILRRLLTNERVGAQPMGEPTIADVLAAVTALDGKLTKLGGDLANLRSDLANLRSDLMDRIGRLQERIVQLHDEAFVTFAQHEGIQAQLNGQVRAQRTLRQRFDALEDKFDQTPFPT